MKVSFLSAVLACRYNDSREAAEVAFAHPDLPAAIVNAGFAVPSMQINYLNEVVS